MLKYKIAVTAVLSAAFAFSPAAAQKPVPEQTMQTEKTPSDIEGSYYLKGVMETGSRLILVSNGQYVWELTVGSLDLFSHGNWTRQGDEITLGPHQFDKSLAAFELTELHPWRDEDRKAAGDMELIRLKNQVKRVCPFLSYGGLWGVDDPVFLADLPPEQRYTEAAAIESKLKAAYQDAIIAYFVPSESADNESQITDARTARVHWELSADFLREAAAAAGKSVSISPPDMPDVCIPSAPARPAVKSADDWSNGFGVWIGGTSYPQWMENVDVTFRFTDGSMVKGNSYQRGFVFVSPNGRKLSGITLSIESLGQLYSSSFDVAKFKEMEDRQVFSFWPDPRMLNKPPFEQATLTVSKGRLTPKSFMGLDGFYDLAGDGE